jgi:hypothetical protein
MKLNWVDLVILLKLRVQFVMIFEGRSAAGRNNMQNVFTLYFLFDGRSAREACETLKLASPSRK